MLSLAFQVEKMGKNKFKFLILSMYFLNAHIMSLVLLKIWHIAGIISENTASLS